MRIRNILRVIALTLVICAFALVLSTCGGGRKGSVVQGLSPGSSQDNKTSPEGLDYPVEVSLDDALTELDALETPDGVEPELFQQLKDELAKQLNAKGVSKIVSAPPTGEANRVDDLATLFADEGAIQLKWKERNVGDYNLDGVVSVSDITPLAIRFGNDATDGVEDGQDGAVDGNKNNVIDISDITPIAINFGTELSGYEILRRKTESEEYRQIALTWRVDSIEVEEVARLYVYTDTGIEPESTYYYELKPFDSSGQRGIESLSIQAMSFFPTSVITFSYEDAITIQVENEDFEAVCNEVVVTFEEIPSANKLFQTVYRDIGGELAWQIGDTASYAVIVADARCVVEKVRDALAPDITVEYNLLHTLEVPQEEPPSSPSALRSVSKSYSDPYRGQQWALDHVNSDSAWDIEEGNGTVIAVIDTGVDPNHIDLRNRLLPGWYIDEWNSNVTDEYGHGTHVTGIIVAEAGNYEGIVGLAHRNRVLPIKCGRSVRGKWKFGNEELARAVNYARMHPVYSVKVINMSLGAYRPLSQSFNIARLKAEAQRIVIVAAAGNDSRDAFNHYPSAYSTILGVGATNKADKRWYWFWGLLGGSNYGSVVEVSAPGEAIISTRPGNTYLGGWRATGTSFAAPHVSAVASLLFSLNYSLTAPQVRSLIIENGKPIDTDKPIGKLLDAYATLGAIATAPSPQPPRNVHVSQGDHKYPGAINVYWERPSSGPIPTSYNIKRSVLAGEGFTDTQTFWNKPRGGYVDSSVLLEVKYEYWVQSVYSGKTSSRAKAAEPGWAWGTIPTVDVFEVSNQDPNYPNAINTYWYSDNDKDGATSWPKDILLYRSPSENGIYSYLTMKNFRIGVDGYIDQYPPLSPGAVYWYKLIARNGKVSHEFPSVRRGQVYGVAGDPPDITSVWPTSGVSGSQITFNANVSGTEPLSFFWYFGGGAVPNSPTQRSPTVILGSPGSYYSWLSVYNKYGNDSHSFILTVFAQTHKVYGHVEKATGGGLSGVYLALNPGGYSAFTNSSGNFTITGVPNGNYTLTPSLNGWSFDPLSRSVTVNNFNVYDQDFTATSALPPDPPTNLQATDGTYTDKIQITWTASSGADYYNVYRATSEGGSYTYIGQASSSPYDDDPGDTDIYWYKAKAHNDNGDSGYSNADSGFIWSGDAEWHTVVADSKGRVGYYASLAVVNGHPAASYSDYSVNGDLKYVRALDSSGVSWDAPVTVDGSAMVGKHTSLAVVDGCPAISYYDDFNNYLKYVRALDVNGNSWGTPMTVDGDGDVGITTMLMIVNGHPAISYTDNGNRDIKFVRASDTTGSAWETPIVVDSTGDLGGGYLAVVNGKPAIGYNVVVAGDFDLKYVRAEDVNGDTWGIPITVDSTGSVGTYISLAVVSGNPAMSYHDLTTANQNLKYVRANDANGDSWQAPVIADGSGYVGWYSSLAVIDGNPAISYYYYYHVGGQDLKYVRANDVHGSNWGTPQTVDSVGDVGKYTSLVVVNGNPAISYQDHTNEDLKFAIYY